MVQGWNGQNTVLTLDPASGEVKQRFEAGYNAVVALTVDKSTLYIYNQAYSGDEIRRGAISAIDTGAGKILWQTDIPGGPFGPSVRSAWLSTDERRLYVEGSPDNSHAYIFGVDTQKLPVLIDESGQWIEHIFVVDTQTGRLLHDFELPLPYPANVDQASPRIWKLSWAETLVVAARD